MNSLIFQVCLILGCVNPVISNETKYENYPVKSRPYLKTIKEVSNNASREAAQTEQESGWNKWAKSAYAKGLRQFTDPTGKWLSRTHCRHLGRYSPYDPTWSIKCGIIYEELLLSNNDYGSYCLNRKIAEQEYNGGNWVIRELRESKSNSLRLSFKKCHRAKWACKENYEYPRRISRRQVKFLKLGGIHCP